ncbi:hypothetical protein ACWDVV_28035, partial [Streptomyces tendae]
MGRHRRSAAGRAATGRAAEAHQPDGTADRRRDPLAPDADATPTMGIAPYLNPEAYAEVRAKSRSEERPYLAGDQVRRLHRRHVTESR